MSETNPASADDSKADVPVVPREYLVPFVLVTSLFAFWGFANDITNPLVKAFKEIFLISNQQSSYVQLAFYGGYGLMAIPAALLIRKFSYKTGILVGLALYATGALLFIPAAANETFGLFMLALCVLTCGLAFLETAANPYILSMGPAATATRRLNLAQAFNPIGSLTGMVVASTLVLAGLQVGEFREQEMAEHPEYATMMPGAVDGEVTAALQDYAENEPEAHGEMVAHDLGLVRRPYVVLGMVLIGVFLVFAIAKMPNTGKEEDPIHLRELVGRLANRRYLGGVVAQAFYVGAQIMCWTFVIHYGVTLLGFNASTAQNWNIAAMITFLIGRWIGTVYLLKHYDAGRVLGCLAIGGALATAAAIYTPGVPGIVCIVAISLFMSVMFPTIYGLALGGMTPNDAKLGSAGLIVAIVGGAFMPQLQGGVIDTGKIMFGFEWLDYWTGISALNGLRLDIPVSGIHADNLRASFCLPLFCFICVAIYGFAVAKRKPA